MLDFVKVGERELKGFIQQCIKLLDIETLYQLVKDSDIDLTTVRQYLFQTYFGVDVEALENRTLAGITNEVCYDCQEPVGIWTDGKLYQTECKLCGQRNVPTISLDAANRGFKFQQEKLKEYVKV